VDAYVQSHLDAARRPFGDLFTASPNAPWGIAPVWALLFREYISRVSRTRFLLAAAVAALLLTGCTAAPPAAPGRLGAAPPVDTECVGGLPFVNAYSAIASRYDPQLEGDRQQLSATHSLATARGLLADLATVLDEYDAALAQLRPPADFADGLKGLEAANQRLRDGAVELAASPFGVTDQATFGELAGERQAALHDLRLQLAFVTSECT
jgi:hypothetical protein